MSDWAEMLLLDTAKPLAYYDHPFFGKYPAITENHFGKGMVTYEGTVLSDGAAAEGAGARARAGAAGGTRPEAARRGAGEARRQPRRQGDPLLLQLLLGAADVVYSYGRGTELLSNHPVAGGATLSLEPWGVAIVEE